MVRIAQEAERSEAFHEVRQLSARPGRTFAEAVAHASVETAIDLCAAAIVAPTASGHTARTISRFRPPCSIIAVTPNPIAQRELMLFWGVYPLLSQRAATTDEVINDAVEVAQRRGYVGEGDMLVVTGGTVEGGVGTTNLMKVHLIERVLARGIGLGDRKLIGRVRRLSAPLSPDLRVEPDEIVVASSTDRSFLPALRRAAGLVTANAAPDAHCRLVALEMGLPAVVGIDADVELFKDGMHIVMDARRGVVYERPPALWRSADDVCG